MRRRKRLPQRSIAPAIRPTSTMSTPTDTIPKGGAVLVRAVQSIHDLHQLVYVVQIVIGPRMLRAEGIAVAREGGPDPELGGPDHVAVRPVPHHDRFGGGDAEQLEGP